MLIDPQPAPRERIGIDESEWSDAPENLADWDTWFRTIKPFELTPDEARRNADFAERMHQFNVEAVRRQMQEGAQDDALPPRHRYRPGCYRRQLQGRANVWTSSVMRAIGSVYAPLYWVNSGPAWREASPATEIGIA